MSRSSSPKSDNDQQTPSPHDRLSTAYYQLHDSPQILEDSSDPNGNEGFRRSLSRRFSQKIRRSWGSKRNSTCTIASPDEEWNCEDWNGEASMKVRRISRQRDWSGELGEDDIQDCRIEASRTSLAEDLRS